MFWASELQVRTPTSSTQWPNIPASRVLTHTAKEQHSTCSAYLVFRCLEAEWALVRSGSLARSLDPSAAMRSLFLPLQQRTGSSADLMDTAPPYWISRVALLRGWLRRMDFWFTTSLLVTDAQRARLRLKRNQIRYV